MSDGSVFKGSFRFTGVVCIRFFRSCWFVESHPDLTAQVGAVWVGPLRCLCDCLDTVTHLYNSQLPFHFSITAAAANTCGVSNVQTAAAQKGNQKTPRFT